MEKLLTVQQVSDLMQISRSLVYKWIHYDFVPYVKIGNIVRFKESELNRWLKNKEHKGRVKYRVDTAAFSASF
jgi:excisionase family DNA binding protein